MDTKTRNGMIREFFDTRCMGILERKGQAYAQTDVQPDANANFKRSAEKAGVDVMKAWLIFFNKHADSVATYIRTGVSPEPIEEILADILNYAAIGYTLLVEEGKINHTRSAPLVATPVRFRRSPTTRCSYDLPGYSQDDLANIQQALENGHGECLEGIPNA